METPTHLRDFQCDDYFASRWAEAGCWDETSQLMLVIPADDVQVRTALDFLVIGRPGVDGIEFGYRRRLRGVWAYYPIDDEFVVVATTTADLVERYTTGRITV